jgi:hypothetical protein
MCGKEFRSMRVSAKYCSPACRVRNCRINQRWQKEKLKEEQWAKEVAAQWAKEVAAAKLKEEQSLGHG